MPERTQDDYTAMQREYYDSRARSLADARALVHPDYPDYGFAAAQAPGFVAFVLREYFAAQGVAVPRRITDGVQLERKALRLSAFGARTKAAGRAARFARRAWGVVTRPITDRLTNVLLGSLRARSDAADDADSPMPRALDFGCGVGRLMRAWAVLGGRVDGVDISAEMLSFAQADPVLKGSLFFASGGADCGEAPDGAYDAVYSAICMQHIASRSIRRSILASMRKALRSGGIVVIQFHYYPGLRDQEIPAPHVSWSTDAFDARGTNSEADVWITPESLDGVLEDFREFFCDPALFFCQFPREAKLFRGAYGEHVFEHLIVTATVGHTRADTIYGL